MRRSTQQTSDEVKHPASGALRARTAPRLFRAKRVRREIHATRERLYDINSRALSGARELDAHSGRVLKDVNNFLAEMELAANPKWSGSVAEAKKLITNTIGGASDIVTRPLKIGRSLKWSGLVAYVDGMVDTEVVDRDIIGQLEMAAGLTAPPTTDDIAHAMSSASSVKTSAQWEEALVEMLLGTTLLFVEGASEILLFDTVKYTQRAITDSKAEPAIKGPQEAFSDITQVQLSQIRRRLPTPDLRFESLTTGKYSHTKVQLAYIRGLTNPALVNKIALRIGQIDRDWVQLGNQISSYLTQRRMTLFPVVRITDRVDIVARDLMQGKIAILIPNDPFAVTLPNRLLDFYQTTQDYVFNFWESSLIRILRFVGLLAGLYVMPFYIALTSVDPDLMPTRLLLTLTGGRIGVPFPPVTEAAIMWIVVEVLREAANRMPQQLATPIGTVGAVIVGTAIVKAGLVDPVVIIGVTLTALGLFTTPTFEMNGPWRWIFWVLVLGSYLLGVYGIALVTFGLIGYLASLEVFGVPYLAPIAPFDSSGLNDSVVRFPIKWLDRRPVAFHPLDASTTKPAPPDFDRMDLEQWPGSVD